MSNKERDQIIQEFLDRDKIFLSKLESVDLDSNWKEFKEKLEEKSGKDTLSIVPRRRKRMILAMAAALAVLVTFSFLLVNIMSGPELEMKKISALQKNTEFMFSDGSQVVLRQGSEIEFLEGKMYRRREVNLTGEAFFEIQRIKSVPFLVHTKSTIIQVMGTSFNIREEENGDVVVSVISGQVRVSEKDNKSNRLTLGPGERGTFNKNAGAIAAKEFHSENFLSWKTHSLSFNNASLETVFAALEKHFGVEIEVKDLEILKNRITSTFKKQDVKEIMDEISLLFDLKYTLKNDTIIAQINR